MTLELSNKYIRNTIIFFTMKRLNSMRSNEKKRVLFILGLLYVISFSLPVIYSIHDVLLGFHCAVWGIIRLVVNLSEGNAREIILDALLILPNILLILAVLFRKRFRPWLKYLFFFITLISAGSWIFTFRIYLQLDDDSVLQMGYWLWFFSITSYMFVVATPTKK